MKESSNLRNRDRLTPWAVFAAALLIAVRVIVSINRILSSVGMNL